MTDKNTFYSITQDFIPFLGHNVLQRSFEDEFASAIKNNSHCRHLFSLPPSVDCSCRPRLHTMGVFSTSSVRAVAPTMHDICITLPGSKPTVKMVWVNERAGGWTASECRSDLTWMPTFGQIAQLEFVKVSASLLVFS